MRARKRRYKGERQEGVGGRRTRRKQGKRGRGREEEGHETEEEEERQKRPSWILCSMTFISFVADENA